MAACITLRSERDSRTGLGEELRAAESLRRLVLGISIQFSTINLSSSRPIGCTSGATGP